MAPLLTETVSDSNGAFLREWFCEPPDVNQPFTVVECTWLDEANPKMITIQQVHKIRMLTDA